MFRQFTIRGNVSAVYERLAAALSALQMGVVKLLVQVPIEATVSKDAFQWGKTVISFALTAGMPWLATKRALPVLRQ